jgi:splicing suppressor protein 51
MLEFIRTRGSNPFPDSEDAIRTLSSLLTFPLTLSYGISYLFPHGSYGPTADKLNVLVLGARSESSLPALWWKELLAHSGKIANFNIRMLGPGLQLNNSLGKHDRLSVGGAARSVQIENNFPAADCDDMKLFHGHAEAMPLLRWADVFVLYNPGYGTQALKESWAPSLRLLLMTRKPVLCTAYGSHDLRRDLSFLDEITMQEDDQDLGEPIDFLIPPHENPFKSFKCTIDPKEEGDQGIVTTNHSIYAFAAK